jgi:AraC-like DNA-binding protein
MKSRCSTIRLSGEVQVLHAQYEGRAFAPHWHHEYAIGLIDSGVEGFDYQGRSHCARTGQIVLLDAGEIHTGEAADERGFGFRMLYVQESVFRDIAKCTSTDIGLHFKDAVIDNERLAQDLLAAHQSLEDGSSRLEAEFRLTTALADVLLATATWKPRTTWNGIPSSMLSARDYLDDHIADDVSLETLASMSGLSKYHFARTFKEWIGMPPHAYQMQQRVLRAKQFLRVLSPAQAAQECGFYDQSHLNRAFRLFAGTTPGNYAQQFR